MLEDDEKEYAVNKILDRRLVVKVPNPTHESYEYLVSWKDCGEEENTWEPYENVKKCKEDIDALNRRLGKSQKKSSVPSKKLKLK